MQKEYEENAKKYQEEITKRENEAKEQFEKGEISEAQYKTMLTAATKYAERPIITAQENNNQNNQDNYLLEEDYLDMTNELTEEDKKYLALK